MKIEKTSYVCLVCLVAFRPLQALAPNEYTSLDAHGQLACGESPDTIGTLAANSDDAKVLQPAVCDDSTSVDCPCVSNEMSFDETADLGRWSKLFAEDFAGPSGRD